METLPLGTSPLQATRIAYGCMEIGGTWNRNEALSADTQRAAVLSVRAALDSGITFFDHADIYCAGKSEQAFGALLAESPELRGRMIVQSKCGIRFGDDPVPGAPARYDFSHEHILRSVEGSLRRLRTDYLDVLLLHRPDALMEPEEVARAFDALHASGKVRWFGVSNHSMMQMELLRRFVRQPIVANQVELSLLHAQLIDEGVTFNQDVPGPARGLGTLDYCRLNNITLQAWGPLGHGAVLTGKSARPGNTARETSQAVQAMARQKGVSPEAIAVAWLLRHPARMQVVIGSKRPERIRAACEALNVSLTREEWYELFVAGRGARMP